MSDPKPIPGFGRYGITEDARIFNLKTGMQLRTSSDVRGYRYTILVNDDGERKGMKRHRLVALTHLDPPPGPIEDYVVHHKDDTPGNDWKDNLEWCTQKENVGYWKQQKQKRVSVAVDVLDVETGETTRYSSVGLCSRALNINRYSIQGRLNRGPECVWPEGKRYRYSAPNTTWPPAKNIKVGRSRRVIMRDLKTNNTVTFEKLSDVLPYVGFKLPTVWQWANDPTQPVVPGLYQIQFVDNIVPWREVDDVFIELEKTMGCKVVLRYNANWESPVWYKSAVRCCEMNNIKPTALNYRLKAKGNKVFSDGFRYCYYTELPDVHRETIRYEVPPEGCVQRPSKAAAPWCRVTSV